MKNTSLRFFIALVLFGVSSCAYGQFSRDQVIGSWLCQDVILVHDSLTTEKDTEFAKVCSQGFLNSSFTFKPDSTFSYEVVGEEISFAQIIKSMSGAKWSFDADSSVIRVGVNSMNIAVKKEANTIYFQFAGMPLLLRMKRTD